MKKIFTIIIIFFVGLFFYKITTAFEIKKYDDKVENRIVLTPTKFEISSKCREEIFKKITFINRLGEKKKFKVLNEEFIKDKNNKNLKSSASWIEPELNEFNLEHGERIKMDVKIKVPENLPAGGYYSYLTFIAEDDEKSDNLQNIKIKSALSIPILITVGDSANEFGTIKKFITNKKFYFWGPIKFFVIFENLGDVHLASSGEISIYNFLNSKVAQKPLEEKTVFPQSEITWESSWKKNFLVGIYKAKLNCNFGNNSKQFDEKEISFFAFPLHLLVLVIILIVILHFILKRLFSKFEIKKKNDKTRSNN